MNDTVREQYIKHLDSILKAYRRAERDDDLDFAVHGIISRTKTAVEKIAGLDSHYMRDILEIADSGGHIRYTAQLMASVVEALRSDLEDGFIGSISELIRAEVFRDYLDMADHLLGEGYKDPAAVLAGSTLEAHLRQLCAKHGIDTTRVHNGRVQAKRAGELNQELARSVYSAFDHKQITAWQNLRNDAAHGHYGGYSADDVERFVGWLRDFVVRHPA